MVFDAKEVLKKMSELYDEIEKLELELEKKRNDVFFLQEILIYKKVDTDLKKRLNT